MHIDNIEKAKEMIINKEKILYSQYHLIKKEPI